MGLGGGVKCLIYFLEGGSGQHGNPSGYTLGGIGRGTWGATQTYGYFREGNMEDSPRSTLTRRRPKYRRIYKQFKWMHKAQVISTLIL